MSEANWFDGLVPWSELAGLVSRTLLPQVPATPAAALRMAADSLVGRKISTKVGEQEVTFTLTVLDYRADSLMLATGKLGDIRLVAEDITWPETPLKRVTLIAPDVRFRSLPTPTVLPGAVRIVIVVAAEVLRDRVAELRPGILADAGRDGMLEIRSAKRPRLGFAELEPSVDGESVLLRPRTLHVAGRAFRLPRWLKPITLPLPELPPGLRLTAVEPLNGDLLLHTVADHWPERLSSIPLTDLLSWLTTAARTLTLPRLPPRNR